MVQDIKIDINNKDIKVDTKLYKKIFFSITWDGPNFTIIPPLGHTINIDIEPVYIKIPYKPLTEELSMDNRPCYGTIDGKYIRLTPAKLMLINSDGFYCISGNKDGSCTIYSACETDFTIANADNQTARLMCLCAPGKNYRYPITGVGISKYLNSIIERTDIGNRLVSEFQSDNISLDDATYDVETKKLNLGLTECENYENIVALNTNEIINPDETI